MPIKDYRGLPKTTSQPDNGDTLGDIAVKNEVFDGDERVNVNLRVDEGDADQIVGPQLPQDDPLPDVRHQVPV